MGKLEDDIIQLIDFRYGSRAEFSRVIGMSEQTVYSVLSASIINATFSTTIPIAAGLNLDPFKLAEGILVEQDPSVGSIDVPFFGSISAGDPIDMLAVSDTFPAPAQICKEHPDVFFLKVKGTSMNRILPDGCYALIAPCRNVDNPGAPYAVAIGGDTATIKLVTPLANGVKLEPCSDDPTHRPAIFDFSNENTEEITVIGRVVWYCPPADWSSRSGL